MKADSVVDCSEETKKFLIALCRSKKIPFACSLEDSLWGYKLGWDGKQINGYILPSGSKQFVPLSEFIKFIEDYIVPRVTIIGGYHVTFYGQDRKVNIGSLTFTYSDIDEIQKQLHK